MAIIMSRVDERLIHGQMALAWLKQYSVDVVIVIDDESAGDMLKTMLLQMAVSGTVECIVTKISEAKDRIEEAHGKRVFLCAASPRVFLELLKQGVEIPHINIGGIYDKPGRVKYYTTVFLDEETKKDILELGKFPVKIEYRQVPRDNETDILSLLRK